MVEKDKLLVEFNKETLNKVEKAVKEYIKSTFDILTKLCGKFYNYYSLFFFSFFLLKYNLKRTRKIY